MKRRYIAIFLVMVLLLGVAGVSRAKEGRWKFQKGVSEFYYPSPAGDNLSSHDPYLSFYILDKGRFHLRDAETAEILLDCELPKLSEQNNYWSPMIVEDGVVFSKYPIDDEGNRIIVHIGFDGKRTDYNFCEDAGMLFWDKRPFLVEVDNDDKKLVAYYLDDCSVKWEIEVDEEVKSSDKIYSRKIRENYILLGNSHENGFKQIVDVRNGKIVCDVPGEYGKLYGFSDHFFIFMSWKSPVQKMTFIKTSDWKVVKEFSLEGLSSREFFTTLSRGNLFYFMKVIDYEPDKFNTGKKCEIDKFNIETGESEFFVISLHNFNGDLGSSIEFAFKDILDDILLVITGYKAYLVDITRDKIIYEFEENMGAGNGRVPSIRDNGVMIYMHGGYLEAFDVKTFKYIWKMKTDDVMSYQEIGDFRYHLIPEIRNGEYHHRIDIYNMKSEMFEPYSYYIQAMYQLSGDCRKHFFPDFYCFSKHGILCMPFMPDNRFRLFKPGVDEPYYEITTPFRDNYYITEWDYTDDKDIILIHAKMIIPGDKVIEKFYDYEFDISKGLLTEIAKKTE